MLIFPDPAVSTEYTDPNGSVWEFNGTGWVRQPESSDDCLPPGAYFDAGLDAMWFVEIPRYTSVAEGYTATARAWTPDLTEMIGETKFKAFDWGDLDPTTYPDITNAYAAKGADDEGSIYFICVILVPEYKVTLNKINRYGQHSKVFFPDNTNTSGGQPNNIFVADSHVYITCSQSGTLAQNIWRIPRTGADPVDANGGIELLDGSSIKEAYGGMCFQQASNTGQWIIGGGSSTGGSTHGSMLFNIDEASGAITRTHYATYTPQGFRNGASTFDQKTGRLYIPSYTTNTMWYFEFRGSAPYPSTRAVNSNWALGSSTAFIQMIPSAYSGNGAGVAVVNGNQNSLAISNSTRYTLFKFDDRCAASPFGGNAFGSPKSTAENPHTQTFYALTTVGVWMYKLDSGTLPEIVGYSIDPYSASPITQNQIMIYTASPAQLQAGSVPFTAEEQAEFDAESDRMYAEHVEREIARIESELQSATGEEKDQLNEQLSFFRKEQSE